MSLLCSINIFQCLQVNTAILEQLIELRARLAKLLGFSSHANYVLEMTMAKNSENVAQFLGMFSCLFYPIYSVKDQHLHSGMHRLSLE